MTKLKKEMLAAMAKPDSKMQLGIRGFVMFFCADVVVRHKNRCVTVDFLVLCALVRYSAAYAQTLKRSADTEGGGDAKKPKLPAPTPVKAKSEAKPKPEAGAKSNPKAEAGGKAKPKPKPKSGGASDLSDKLKEMLAKASGGGGGGGAAWAFQCALGSPAYQEWACDQPPSRPDFSEWWHAPMASSHFST